MRRTRPRLHGCEGVLGSVLWYARVCSSRQDLPFECFCEAVLVALDLEDLDGLVGGACG